MEDLLKNLNQEQLRAVTHTQGPLMIIAGAGTGKTTVITQRIGWMIEQGLAKPEEILALTFTEKAAAEMEERVDRLLPYGYIDLFISTFHAFCERILRQYGVDMGLSQDFTLLNELGTWLLARKEFDRFTLDYYRPLGNPTRFLKALLQHFSRAKDEMISSQTYLAYAQEQQANLDANTSNEELTTEVARIQELANAYHTYQQILLENDCLDFGDLILSCLQLLEKRPQVLKQVREQFPFILVDEFQDTNWAQYKLIKLLAAPKNNLTVVGDDDQSIYKFRGASLSNILQFENDFPKSAQVILTKNYRSLQTILDHAHRFIQANNPNRLETRQERGSTISKKLISQKTETGIVEHLHADTLEQEVSLVIEKIFDLKEQHPDLHWNDFGILVRANHSAEPFVQALEQARIPYQFMALRGLYTKPAILDVLAWLRTINRPYDSVSFYRILCHPLFNIPSEDLLLLCHQAKKKGLSIFEVCRDTQLIVELQETTRQTVSRLLSLLSEFYELTKTKKATEIFLTVTKETGLLKYMESLPEGQKQELFRWFQQFYRRIQSFESRYEEKSLSLFLEEFEREREAGETGALSFDIEAGPDVVSIMTIHGSKGLEFRYVFVVNLVDRRFPTTERKEAIELPLELIQEHLPEGNIHLQEERRLFYVAMTRAKDGLFLTSAKDYGGIRKKKISRFLQELGFIQEQQKDQIFEKKTVFSSSQIKPVEQKKDKEISFSLPKYYSFTQLAAFQTCPLQYKFAHLFHIPVFGKWTASYGKTLHQTLQQWFTIWKERQGSVQQTLFVSAKNEQKFSLPVSLKELLEIYEKTWIDEWYPTTAFQKNKKEQGREDLQAYAKSLQQNPPNPIFVEHPFTLKIENISLRGRIDRIDNIEGGVEIIDYKTGTAKTEKTLTKKDKQQLFLYQIAVKEILGLEPKKLTFVYLSHQTSASFLGSEKELNEAKKLIMEEGIKIQTSSFEATPGRHCSVCDFADICEFAQR